ncbi:hypothetical protein JW905_03315, partial [bacterium]|nr:hypothetical protein [candidate division CSSED10-310 bacterium]
MKQAGTGTRARQGTSGRKPGKPARRASRSWLTVFGLTAFVAVVAVLVATTMVQRRPSRRSSSPPGIGTEIDQVLGEFGLVRTGTSGSFIYRGAVIPSSQVEVTDRGTWRRLASEFTGTMDRHGLTVL